ncbi:hypothetical protein A2Y85_03325 [candidate division WOR-3 bacterium RBG_13_43_14]|uniref:Putative regulatory protein FmdB zinc ribbon domain-containing protein n=1 Tax=candidate division WOR-3 bacterium RBG_13_43_14 TaxID=1802590 RepID=A0A1F4UA48_UNCW3|nr:MAG: hypothetical protein A2Y85_03325 [candidate division WOR-3 bacterium RBG_13_43_14]
MPIYEYRCEKCGATFELLFEQSSKQHKIICKHCGSDKIHKLISKPAAVIMKNSSPSGSTCCGKTERCDTPPCSTDGTCRRD